MGSLLQKMIQAQYDAQTIWKKIFVIHIWLKTKYNKCDSCKLCDVPEILKVRNLLYFFIMSKLVAEQK